MKGWGLSGSQKANKHWQSGGNVKNFYPYNAKKFQNPVPGNGTTFTMLYGGIFDANGFFSVQTLASNGAQNPMQYGPTILFGCLYGSDAIKTIYKPRKKFYSYLPKDASDMYRVKVTIKEVSRPDCFKDYPIWMQCDRWIFATETGIGTPPSITPISVDGETSTFTMQNTEFTAVKISEGGSVSLVLNPRETGDSITEKAVLMQGRNMTRFYLPQLKEDPDILQRIEEDGERFTESELSEIEAKWRYKITWHEVKRDDITTGNAENG